MSQTTQDDGQAPGAGRGTGTYPRTFQVSVTETTARALRAAADRVKVIRKLPRRSDSLIIRELLEEKFGGKAVE